MLAYKTIITDIIAPDNAVLGIKDVDKLRDALELLGAKGFECKGLVVTNKMILAVSQKEVSGQCAGPIPPGM